MMRFTSIEKSELENINENVKEMLERALRIIDTVYGRHTKCLNYQTIKNSQISIESALSQLAK